MALNIKDPGTDALAPYIERARLRPVLDPRPAEEILGYDDAGLPR